MENEQWLPVVGWESLYEVSDMGRVRRIGAADVRKSHPDKWGRHYLALSGGGRKQTLAIHRMVLEAFVGPRQPGQECLHRNDIQGDNRLTNLRWGTHAENQADCVRNGNHHAARRTHCVKGHEFTPENTAHWKRNGVVKQRHCRQCHRDANNARYQDANPGARTYKRTKTPVRQQD